MSAELITVAWTVTALLALMGHLWAANDARIDLRSILTDGHMRSLIFTARGNLHLSLALAMVQAIDLAIGILAFMNRPDTPSRASPSEIAVLITIGIVGQELMLLVISFTVVWFRRRLRAIVREEIAAK